MQSDNAKFKKEFKERLYRWVLKLIKELEKLLQELVEIADIFASSILTLKGRK
ncbi:MAG: hypothetical protein HY435_01850 [Candidatus Liptonbacteria bacterium]|nr:hypothetical protein [Candidatus Liptonbacteria bacterium]